MHRLADAKYIDLRTQNACDVTCHIAMRYNKSVFYLFFPRKKEEEEHDGFGKPHYNVHRTFLVLLKWL